jgi:peptidoglycan/LPS O-acetylase OafA/YrhL
VALVVTYHLWPSALPGGYVGVDVFFVISGYLITGQLLREIARTGRVRVVEFWARRVRRLLPAALLVLLVVAITVWLFVPETLWQQFFSEIGGSSVYLQNWVLVSHAVDYFTSQSGASPVQNFWSLSVEEQFYLLWPLLIIVPLAIRKRPRARRILTFAILAAGTVASFVYSIHETSYDSSVSYLSTATRAWEFGAGGLLALVTVPPSIAPHVRAAVSWAGIGAILLSAVEFSGSTPFPGTAALLPVAGVVAVIAAGLPQVAWAPSRLMVVRPVQSLGDASYSLYLWHWPLIVLVPYVIAAYAPSYSGPGNLALVGILLASLALAYLSKRYIEDPARSTAWLAGRKPVRTFALMAGAMAIVVAVSGLGWNTVQLDTESSQATEAALLAQDPACFGAAALATPGQTCTNVALDGVLVPTPVTAASEIPAGCQDGTLDSKVSVCYSGVPASEAATTVAVIGDSHATQWLPALQSIAKANRWRIVEITKGSCAFNGAARKTADTATESCATWNKEIDAELAKLPQVSTVITSADVEDLFAASAGKTGFQNAVSGYEAAWAGLPSTITKVDVIDDIPRPSGNAQTCLELKDTSGRLASGACSLPRTDAVVPDPIATAADHAGGRVQAIDMDNYFCTSSRCDPVIGHVMVYRDTSHMTTTYSTTLGPYLAAKLSATP